MGTLMFHTVKRVYKNNSEVFSAHNSIVYDTQPPSCIFDPNTLEEKKPGQRRLKFLVEDAYP